MGGGLESLFFLLLPSLSLIPTFLAPTSSPSKLCVDLFPLWG